MGSGYSWAAGGKADLCPPCSQQSHLTCMVKRLLCQMESKWWHKLMAATHRVPETQELSPRGCCSDLGDNHGPWIPSAEGHCRQSVEPLGTGLSNRTTNTRADLGIDAGGVCSHAQSQEDGQAFFFSFESSSYLLPSLTKEQRSVQKAVLWIACCVYMTQTHCFLLGVFCNLISLNIHKIVLKFTLFPKTFDILCVYTFKNSTLFNI